MELKGLCISLMFTKAVTPIISQAFQSYLLHALKVGESCMALLSSISSPRKVQ